jgi:hypothetical protein
VPGAQAEDHLPPSLPTRLAGLAVAGSAGTHIMRDLR